MAIEISVQESALYGDKFPSHMGETIDTDEIAVPPPGFRILKEGEIIPESYIFYYNGTWTFNYSDELVGEKFDTKTIREDGGKICPFAISIFHELSDNLNLISAELKRTIDDSVKEIASMQPEVLGGIIMQAILCGDFFKNVDASHVSYLPYGLCNTLKEKLYELTTEYNKLKSTVYQSKYCIEPKDNFKTLKASEEMAEKDFMKGVKKWPKKNV